MGSVKSSLLSAALEPTAHPRDGTGSFPVTPSALSPQLPSSLQAEESLNVSPPQQSLVPPADPGEQLPIHWQSTNYYLFNSCVFNTYKEHVQQGFAVVNNPWNDVFNKPHFKSRSRVEKWLDERPLYDCCNLFCRELKPPIIWHEWHHFFFLPTQRCTVSIFRDLI